MASESGTVRRARWRGQLLLGVPLNLLCALLLVGCGIGSIPVTPPPPGPVPAPRPVAEPTDCTQSPSTATQAWYRLNAALPGQKLCLVGRYPPETVLSLTRSGTSAQPIVLESNGAVLGGIRVDADNVVVRGFNLRGGGITAQGQNISIVDNDVRDAEGSGVLCAPCRGARVTGNTVIRADGVGIVLSGQDSSVVHNDVSQSVRRSEMDADGIGFRGSGLVVQDNYVHDIGTEGYPPDQVPHADCFRTANSTDSVSSNTQLLGNVCANVAGHCLTASGTSASGGASSSGPVLDFEGNYCQSDTPEAIELTAYPGVRVQRNVFSSDYRAAVLATQGSTGLSVLDNTLVGGFPPLLTDATSTLGLAHSGNIRR